MRHRYSHLIRRARIAACALSAILLSACGPRTADLLHEAPKKAGKNRTELESVLEHYRTADPDSQKLAATEFLIANMAGQYTLTSAGNKPRITPYHGTTSPLEHFIGYTTVPKASNSVSSPTATDRSPGGNAPGK